MTKKKDINLFFTCDENYIPFFAIALESIRANCSKEYNYVVRVLHSNSIKFVTQTKLIEEYQGENFEIEFVNIFSHIRPIFASLHTRDYYSKSTYYRLFIPTLYPEIDKALYLDSDIVVLGDIAKLFNTDLGDNLVGAISDQSVGQIQEFQDYAENRIGVDSYNDYFNAGILLMNLAALRDFDFQNKFIELLNRVTFNVAQDQDYLNTLCKNRVYKIDASWNVMPIPGTQKPTSEIKLIHYNLSFKPWHTETLYEDEFWKYAKMTSYYEAVREIRDNYDANLQKKSSGETTNLILMTKEQAQEAEENAKIKAAVEEVIAGNFTPRELTKKDPERLKIMARIKEYEKKGWFDKDTGDNPPAKELLPDQVDYLRKSWISKIKTAFSYSVARKALNKLIKDEILIIDDIIGSKNWTKVTSGAVITCNHFSPMDSFAMQLAYEKSRPSKKRKMFKVINQANYTSMPGLYGLLMRNCYTLPLSNNRKTMEKFLKAVDVILQRGDYVLVYPEQSLWLNYRKPKPLKPGAFKFAVKNNVPVIPVFITMLDSEKMGADGFPIQALTVHIMEPLYPNSELTRSEQIQDLMARNFALWKDCYEKTYDKKLKYTTES